MYYVMQRVSHAIMMHHIRGEFSDMLSKCYFVVHSARVCIQPDFCILFLYPIFTPYSHGMLATLHRQGIRRTLPSDTRFHMRWTKARQEMTRALMVFGWFSGHQTGELCICNGCVACKCGHDAPQGDGVHNCTLASCVPVHKATIHHFQHWQDLSG